MMSGLRQCKYMNVFKKQYYVATVCRSSKYDPNTVPVFAVDTKRPILSISDVCSVMRSAQETYATKSARIEYCKSRNVDYEAVVQYLHCVNDLIRLLKT
jgi:hypothetical protein